ncbi:glycosyltransferase [Flavobacterium urumqiense]|uniref:Glycosyltransferase involved in cell wall bisynthesis n=1 Tax=Flavobacterium urumqiense TaxID=935224 RepID=A0A1H5Y3G7_9FLAO|nr:glycosyltransferase [Flavobacterium urumqiense]SEG18609.1 Glycosyltransferase involved in cell wall bisynthesis [Flavobacterium urumqiense]
MKIIFLCGSLEPGKDGVGDYTRRLAGELNRQGHSCAIVAIMDKAVKETVGEQQNTEYNIPVLRLPFSKGYTLNCLEAKSWLDSFNPDWISLQYVPFSFHPKGLPFGLSIALQQLTKGRKLHLMIHELWVGMNRESSLKLKILGKLQHLMLQSFIKNCSTNLIHTQTKLYQFQLKQMGYRSQFLPLFSNVRLAAPIVKLSRKNEMKFAFFGGIHHDAPVKEFIEALKSYSKSLDGVLLKFVFIGNCGNSILEWTSVLDAESISYEIYGFCSDKQITNIFSTCHYAVATTPFILLQKSGSVAAYLQHQLPIICVARKWEVKNFYKSAIIDLKNITKFENEKKVIEILNQNFDCSVEKSLQFVANKFLKGLIKH